MPARSSLAHLAALFSFAASHFVWLERKESPAHAVATFSETPTGKPGPTMFIKTLTNRTSGCETIQPATNYSTLAFTLNESHGFAELTAPLSPGSLPDVELIEGSALWGLFPEMDPTNPPLLQYWFSAPRVVKPNDWFYIDDSTSNRLVVTLRPLARDTPSNGSTPVVLVVRFDGDNMDNVTVHLFGESGAPAGTATTDGGIATVMLPEGQRAFAWTKHVEPKAGVDPVSGKPYTQVAHYATSSILVQPWKPPSVEEGSPINAVSSVSAERRG